MKILLDEDFSSVKDFSEEELLNLKKLNISKTDFRDDGTIPDSYFKNYISDYLNGYLTQPKIENFICRAFCDNQEIGWGFLENKYVEKNELRFQVYIHPDFRRKGIAKRLLYKALSFAKKHNFTKIIALPWSRDSYGFYNFLNAKEIEGYECYRAGKMEFIINE